MGGHDGATAVNRWANWAPRRRHTVAVLLLAVVSGPAIGAAAAPPRPAYRLAAVTAPLSDLPLGTTVTRFGPLTPADRDMLVKVRQAGLWEGPSGRNAQIRSANTRVRDAGIHLVSGHAELDAKVLAIGQALGVTLPAEPSAQQQGWLHEMDIAPTPQAFDQVFVDRLRAAHGKVYALLSQIRVGTRNTLIRTFAQRCMEVVLDHITALERTGVVDFTKLPLPVLAAAAGPPEADLTQTPSGPITAAGRDFLVKVRLAGLWEGPSGRQAQQRAGSPLVKEAGQHLIAGHAELDAKDLALARKLGVALPTEPNTDQKTWMAQMASAPTPQAFDQVFVDRLRAAHGKVYTFLAEIRTGTRNNDLRAFAERAMTIVLDHISMLERTGLVNFDALPLPPSPAAGPTKGPKGPAKGVGLYLIAAMIGITALGSILAARQFRNTTLR